MPTEAVPIGVAVVRCRDCFLVGVRGPDGPLPGLAEFPGGKCRPGESPEACAVRECREESGLAIHVESLLLQRRFEYAHGTLDLHFFLCRPESAASVETEHRRFRWVPRQMLGGLQFPAANAPLIDLLKSAGSIDNRDGRSTTTDE